MFTIDDLTSKLNELDLAHECLDDSPYVVVYDDRYSTIDGLLADKRIKELQSFLDSNGIDYTWDADEDNVAIFIELPIVEEQVEEAYVEDEPGKYTVWSASDLVESKDQIPLVKIETTDEGKLQAVAVGDDEFDKESHKIAQNVINYAYNHGKTNPKDILVRIDKTLNHADPFFSVEIDRSVANSGYELLAAQTLRTLRDDLKAVVNTKGASEQAIVDKYAELTGVNYYTDKVIDKDQYETLNHADPFFSVEIDRSVANSGYELLAAQTLRTLRDDLKAVVNTKGASEQAIVDKYAELTGVNYYTDKVIDKDQYETILKLQNKSTNIYEYEKPDENEYMKRLKDLAENLIEKVLLKEDPDFYKR
nr:hypothetical protein DGKKSRWO_DGKKSRWO_CDS_0050 [uncultured phage]